jgi:hypothetical protein
MKRKEKRREGRRKEKRNGTREGKGGEERQRLGQANI